MRYYRKKGIGYTETEMEEKLGGSEMAKRSMEQLPNFWLSLIPLVLIIALCMIFQLGLGMSSYPACTLAQICGVVVCCVMHWSRISDKIGVINKAALTSVVPLVQTCVVVGYATIVTYTSAYSSIDGCSRWA